MVRSASVSPLPPAPVVTAVVIRVLACGLFAITLTLLARVALSASGGVLLYSVDDAYIALTLARTLATSGVWGMSGDAFAGVGTTLLWPMLLAVARLVWVSDWWPLVLNAICGAGTLIVASRTIERHVSSRLAHLALLIALVVATPLAALAMTGMEHSFQAWMAIALAASAARILSKVEAVTTRDLVWIGCLAALAVGSRYDTGAVIAGVALVAVARGRWPVAVAVLAGGAVPALLFAVMAWSHGWPLVPVSILLKTRVNDVALDSWRGWIDLAFRGPVGMLRRADHMLLLVVLALGFFVRRPADAGSPGARESRALVAVFLVTTFVQYDFGAGALDIAYRYDAYLVSLGIVAVGCAAGRAIAEGAWRRSPWSVRAGAMALAMIFAQSLAGHGWTATKQAIADVRELHRTTHQLGRLLAAPELPMAAVQELGLTTYLGNRAVMDLDGLAALDVFRLTNARQWNETHFATLAAGRGVRIAAVWAASLGYAAVPADWRRVGEWRTGEGASYVFFAADADAESRLSAALTELSATLPEGVTLQR
jgi:hypothetical protein